MRAGSASNGGNGFPVPGPEGCNHRCELQPFVGAGDKQTDSASETIRRVRPLFTQMSLLLLGALFAEADCGSVKDEESWRKRCGFKQAVASEFSRYHWGEMTW